MKVNIKPHLLVRFYVFYEKLVTIIFELKWRLKMRFLQILPPLMLQWRFSACPSGTNPGGSSSFFLYETRLVEGSLVIHEDFLGGARDAREAHKEWRFFTPLN